jgi:hypothetical protein
VLLEDLVDEGQPEPRTPLLRRVERLEDARQDLRGDPPAGVGDLGLDRLPGAPGPHRRRPAARHRLAAVAQQVQEDRAELTLVGAHAERPGGELPDDLHAGGRELGGEEVEEAADHLVEVLPAEGGLREAREGEVLLRDAVQPVHLARDRVDELARLGGGGPARELLDEELGVEADGVERVADLVGDLGGDPADRGEPLGPAQLLALASEGGRHVVELPGEEAELVPAPGLDLAREVAGGDGLHALGERLDGREEALRHEEGADADGEGEQRVDDGEEDGPALGALRGVDPVGDARLQRDLEQLHVEGEPLLELANGLGAGVEGGAGARVLALARLEGVEERARLPVVVAPARVEGVEARGDLVEEAGVLGGGEGAGLAHHPAALGDPLPHVPGEAGAGDRQVHLARGPVEAARLEGAGRHPVLHLELGRDAGQGEVPAREEPQLLADLVEPGDAEPCHRREGEQRHREGEEDLGRDAAHGGGGS